MEEVNLNSGDEEWRHMSIRHRLEFALFKTSAPALVDVDFLVGPHEELISAHKLILCLSSQVLCDLIVNNQDQQVKGQGQTDLPLTIKLPLVTPPLFKKLLKFIYTDQLEVDGNLPEFLRAAEQFGFTRLAEQTKKMLEKTPIGDHNVITMLNVAKELNHDNLENSALRFIKENANRVFALDEFDSLSVDGLRSVLMSDELMKIREVDVFRAVRRWGLGQNQNQLKERDGDGGGGQGQLNLNLKDVVGSARLLIRYREIPYDVLLGEVKTSGLLSSGEFLQVLKTFMDPTDNPLRLVTKPRFNGLFPEPPVKKKKLDLEQLMNNHNTDTPSSFIIPSPIFPHSSLLLELEHHAQIAKQNQLNHLMPRSHPLTQPHAHGYQDQVAAPAYQLPMPPQPHPPALAPPHTFTTIPTGLISADGGSSAEEYFLENTSNHFHTLLSSIQQKHSTLKRILLRNVHILDIPKGDGAKLYLPLLEEFNFFQAPNFPSHPQSQFPPALPDKSFLCGSSMRDFLFFEKCVQSQWKFSNLLPLGITIKILVRGIKFMEYSPLKGKLTLAYPDQEEADYMLENLCQVDIQTLCLSSCNIKTPSRLIHSSSSITNLILHKVSINGMSCSEFVKLFGKLRTLCLHEVTGTATGAAGGGSGGGDRSRLHLLTSFSKSFQYLTKLSLSEFRVAGWSKREQKGYNFPVLREIYLDGCKFLGMLQPRKFPNVRKVRIRSTEDTRPTFYFVSRLLGMKRLEELAISKISISGDAETTNIVKSPSSECFPKEINSVLNFLCSAGIVCDRELVPDFLVRKKQDGNWIPVWSETEFTIESQEGCNYSGSGLQEFFAHYETLEQIS